MYNDNNNSIHMTGHIIDKIYDRNGKLIDTIEGHNIVVNSFVKLIMALCKDKDKYNGIQYWAVGSGSTSWDSELPEPSINATKLESEIGRVAINPSDITFLNSNMEPSEEPTNILQIRHIFDVSDCNGEWREFGIFGGDASQDADSGILINKKHHVLINKNSDIMIERTMRFTISLV